MLLQNQISSHQSDSSTPHMVHVLQRGRTWRCHQAPLAARAERGLYRGPPVSESRTRRKVRPQHHQVGDTLFHKRKYGKNTLYSHRPVIFQHWDTFKSVRLSRNDEKSMSNISLLSPVGNQIP